MNQVITTGLNLMPPAFADGLGVWSTQDGTPGSDTYAGAPNAALVAADQDFGTCLEVFKDAATVRLRHMGQTPVPAGIYLRVSARVKALSGNLPDVAIAAYAARADGSPVPGVASSGPVTALSAYGKVECVTAIIGLGARPGVDMVWGEDAAYGHVGLDLSGATGGTVRIESIEVEDITRVFHRELMDWVDVRDFGARGDGVTNDRAAFAAADAAADGRQILVPEGTYAIGSSLGLDHPVRFTGTLSMPDTARLWLNKNFDLDGYTEAFGDALTGFKKAFQALLNASDHEALDLNGRRIRVDAPIDMQAAVGNKDSYANRRVLRNGQFDVVTSPAWHDTVVSRDASWSPANPTRLTNVANAGAIARGSIVTGAQGVGREVYVTSVNVAGGVVNLSQPLWGAPSGQTYEFRRFKYVLDFLGFQNLQRFVIADVEFLCAGKASAVMLPRGGIIFTIRDSFFTGPKDRGVTSAGDACQGLTLDRNQWLSSEQTARVVDRTTIAFNVNRNDAKIRDNRAVKFRHFGVFAGSGNLITGNHWFQGDAETASPRTAGIVLSNTNCKTTITANYVDNSFIEWGNEHDPAPEAQNEFSFGSLTISSNIFTANDAAASTRYIVIRPYGPDHFINGLSICDNVFKHINGSALAAVEGVDADIAPLDMGRARNIQMTGNAYHGIQKNSANPVTIPVEEAGTAAVWEVDMRDHFPFDGQARVAIAVLPEGAVRNGANVAQYAQPFVTVRHGVGRGSFRLNWAQPVRGKVRLTARCDTP